MAAVSSEPVHCDLKKRKLINLLLTPRNSPIRRVLTKKCYGCTPEGDSSQGHPQAWRICEAGPRVLCGLHLRGIVWKHRQPKFKTCQLQVNFTNQPTKNVILILVIRSSWNGVSVSISGVPIPTFGGEGGRYKTKIVYSFSFSPSPLEQEKNIQLYEGFKKKWTQKKQIARQNLQRNIRGIIFLWYFFVEILGEIWFHVN